MGSNLRRMEVKTIKRLHQSPWSSSHSNLRVKALTTISNQIRTKTMSTNNRMSSINRNQELIRNNQHKSNSISSNMWISTCKCHSWCMEICIRATRRCWKMKWWFCRTHSMWYTMHQYRTKSQSIVITTWKWMEYLEKGLKTL
jgi:hypothetical protein